MMHKINVYEDSIQGSKSLANLLVEEINFNINKKGYCTINLPTGNSPINLYKELSDLYDQKIINFKKVVLFNLDELYPITKKNKESYYYYLYHHLLEKTDFDKKNIYLLDGNVKEEKLESFCNAYEKRIENLGGIDIQILGIGRNGHIGFNEPGSEINSITRKVKISNHSFKIISKAFNSSEETPREAITIGIKTILAASKIFLIAWGEKKSSIIKKAIEQKVNSNCPASYLRKHQNVEYILDVKSSSKLNLNRIRKKS